MNPHDEGVFQVSVEHLMRQVLPAAERIERDLASGRRLTDGQLDHMARVLEDLRALAPVVQRHPEHAELALRVLSLYSGLVRRAWQVERAAPGRTA